jgi:sterol desaturase/sphingolipid hydroxylase (fatty acid hydroxylase superfamily)
MTGAQVIVLAMPVFLLAIALEYAIGRARGRDTYRLNDTLGSLGLGVMSQVFDAFGTLFKVAMYSWVFQHVALFELSPSSMWVWIGALLGYDFCYYWLHRAGHRVGVLWAAHVVHHQSEDYNLGTALRQTSSGFLLGWIFYLPLAVAGVPPLAFGVVALIDLLYQFWVHTQQVGKLGWFDRWFCSPSNHRAHHAVNERYLDKNYGGILILWDRLFGTFVEEDDRDPVVYGTRAPLRSFNPLWANLQVYRDLWLDSWRAQSWTDKLRVWFKPPGWQPADVAARWPKPAFDIAAVQRFDPPLPRGNAVLACVLFVAVLAGLGLFLWHVHRLSLGQQLAGSVALLAALWAIGTLTQPRGATGRRADTVALGR